jgi:hypothetical protein
MPNIIYINKKKGKPLSLYEFQLQLKTELKLKKEYAKQQQKVDKFNLNWVNYMTIYK